MISCGESLVSSFWYKENYSPLALIRFLLSRVTLTGFQYDTVNSSPEILKRHILHVSISYTSKAGYRSARSAQSPYPSSWLPQLLPRQLHQSPPRCPTNCSS
ncbi:hypothetical protein L1887_16842 [Cichorium endivia]|nr:hypothetical protein L1887_16836 [Cichorium endivia]KAI3517624.1 hypothetical protein L1887_16839 [Cichorium endivia]KAI3517627.1 hypothetical protein L1887_16842 [Cichorium endivia]